MFFKKATLLITAPLFILVGCAAPLKSPTHEEIIAQAIPNVSEVELGWSKSNFEGPVKNNWLATFNDEKLERLVDEVLKNNRDLEVAKANLEKAALVAQQAGVQLLPDINLSGGAQTTSRGGKSSNGTGISLNIQWELDLWGKLSANSSAAAESFRASEAGFEHARQSLVAQTAKSWYAAVEANLQKRLTQRAVKIYKKLLHIVRVQVEVGDAQEQEVFLVKADLANARERQKYAESVLDRAIRGLEILLGRYPNAELGIPREFISMPGHVPAGLPMELLERRPDLLSAERQVAVAFQRVQVANAAKLPSIKLTGSGGRSSNELIDLIGVSKGFFSLGSNFLAPFDFGGELETQIKIETTQQKAALASYGSVAFNAFNEVEGALSNERFLKQRRDLLAAAVKHSKSALKVTETQYEFGQVDMFSVLQMQARALHNEALLISMKNARIAQRIDLHLALGGGFGR
jgi:NodT family efflux transporter outer membrane factor (OMF) lipoprotein